MKWLQWYCVQCVCVSYIGIDDEGMADFPIVCDICGNEPSGMLPATVVDELPGLETKGPNDETV